MSEFFAWLSANSLATSVLIIAFGLVVVVMILIYFIAFLQGREISFWPPKIGQKLEKKSRDDEWIIPFPTKGMIITSISDNKYKINNLIYSGDRSNIYKSTCGGKDFALKLFWSGIKSNTDEWRSFEQEIKTAEILVHRNIIRIVDRGVSNGNPFIVTEYMPGGTLRDWLKSHELIPGNDILSIANQIADAIDFAHSKGVIHRDIKPENIFFEYDAHGKVALGDFGVAKIFGAIETHPTMDNDAIVGSPSYLSPEVISSNINNKSSDIYSFGIVLFEMICGASPFDGLTEIYSILNAKTKKDAPSIKSFRPVGNQLASRIAQTLSRNPKERPKTAREVLSGVENYILNL